MFDRVWVALIAAVAAATIATTQVAAQDQPQPPAAQPTDTGQGAGAAAQPPQPGQQPAQQEQAGRRVAVLVLASRGVDPDIADSLTEVLIASVAARGGVHIVGKEEFQSQLGQGETSTVECIGSATCLGRVGVELQVHEVIAGTVARRGDGWVFNLNRIDIQTGELVGRAFREVQGDAGQLAGAVQDAVPALYAVIRRPSTLLVTATTPGAEVFVDGLLIGVFHEAPVRVNEIPAGRHEVKVRARGYNEWARAVSVEAGTTLQVEADLNEVGEGGISPLVWIGGGIAIAAGGVATYFGLSSQGEPDQGGTRADAVSHFEDRKTDALIANIAFAGVGAGVVTALIGVLLSLGGGGDSEGADASVRTAAHLDIAPRFSGGTMSIRGSF